MRKKELREIHSSIRVYEIKSNKLQFFVILVLIMDILEAIRTRRATKKFDKSYKMTPEQVKLLMEHALLSPTSYNQQNWRFITITEQSVKDQN